MWYEWNGIGIGFVISGIVVFLYALKSFKKTNSFLNKYMTLILGTIALIVSLLSGLDYFIPDIKLLEIILLPVIIIVMFILLYKAKQHEDI